MLTEDQALSQSAEAVLTDVTDLYKTDSRSELDERRQRTRDGIAHLVLAAKQRI
ncbi:hypothetical protein [Streptomyces sp. NBC_01707]